MKIILSRKGFDSNSGGLCSPIISEELITLPIPVSDFKTEGKGTYDDLILSNGYLYSNLLCDLGYDFKCNNNSKRECHIDPDLSQKRRKNKIKDWKPIFGQCGASSGYLKDTVKVSKGDIFLFFGNYHKVEDKNGKYSYIIKSNDFYSKNDIQVIWGYLQVGEIVRESDEISKYYWHPHSSNKYKENDPQYKNNTLFIAADTLSLNEKLPGAGLFKFKEELVLTEKNKTKANWKREKAYLENNIIGNRKNSSKYPESCIYYAGQWQELGLKENNITEEFIKRIFLNKDVIFD